MSQTSQTRQFQPILMNFVWLLSSMYPCIFCAKLVIRYSTEITSLFVAVKIQTCLIWRSYLFQQKSLLNAVTDTCLIFSSECGGKCTTCNSESCQNISTTKHTWRTTVTELLPDLSQVLKESRPLIQVLCTSVFCEVCSLFWLWLCTVQRLLCMMQLLYKVIKVIDYDRNKNYTNLFLQFCCNKMSTKSCRDGFCANFTSTTLTEAQLSSDSIIF